MKSVIPEFVIALTIALVIICFLEVRSLRCQEKDMRTNIATIANVLANKNLLLEKQDSLLLEISTLKIERQYYSDLIGRESDRFIGYVSILFVILSIIGFVYFVKIIESRINAFESKNQNTYDAQKKDHESHRKEFLHLKLQHSQNSGNMWAIASEVLNNSTASSFWTRIQAVEDFIICAKLKNNPEYNFEVIKSNLNSAKKDIINLQKEPKDFNEVFAENAEKLDNAKHALKTVTSFKNEKIAALGTEIFVIFNELMAQLPKAENTSDEKK